MFLLLVILKKFNPREEKRGTETGASRIFFLWGLFGLDSKVWSYMGILVGGLWAVGGVMVPCTPRSLLRAEW